MHPALDAGLVLQVLFLVVGAFICSSCFIVLGLLYVCCVYDVFVVFLFRSRPRGACVCIYIYIYIHMCVYIYIEREREIDRNNR